MGFPRFVFTAPRIRSGHAVSRIAGGFRHSLLAIPLMMAASLSANLSWAEGTDGSRSDRSPESAGPVATRPAWTQSGIQGSPEPPPPYRAEPAFPSLTFESPLDLAAVPGTDRFCVAEQSGKIYSFPNRAGVSSADLVIDLKAIHTTVTAVYAITFHPQFESNRRFYVCYIEGNDREDGTCVSEFLLTQGDRPRALAETERKLIRWWSGGHNGCSLKFGPDGCLYISTGDGGAPSPPDPLMAGQDVSNLLSCILRIDVDHHDDGLPYAIPADNPFLGMEGVRPEIWAFGFRNPWRMSFDRETGDLWVGDVGWQLWEMIYRVQPGGNYGWPVMEGPQPALPESKRGPAAISPPVVSHPHSEAASITGGFVYRGTRLPELRGAYIYGDFQTGKIWGLRYDGKQVTWHQELAQTPLQLVSFGEDQNGEIYLVDYQRSQQIYQLSKQSAESSHQSFPRRLSETGLFKSLREMSPNPGVVEYAINTPHWADGTVSRRWMAVPGNSPLQVADDSKWMFPNGSVLVKTIFMAEGSGETNAMKALETQILHRERDTWRPYTFAWSTEQTDAELVDLRGFTRTWTVEVTQSENREREIRHRFAARSECQMCHNPWVEMKTTSLGIQSASPLAVTLSQLSRPIAADLDSDVQVSADHADQVTRLEKQGWITGPALVNRNQWPRMVDPYDESCSLQDRVRSYLHVNCAHCHQPHAGGTALIDLTRTVPEEQMQLLNAKPGQGAFGITDARLIRPGDPDGSLLLYRMNKLGSGRMPRIGSDEIDDRAVAMLRDWINALPIDSSVESSDQRQRTIQADQRNTDTWLQDLQSDTPSVHEQALRHLTATTRRAIRLAEWMLQIDVDKDQKEKILVFTDQIPQPEIRDLFERFHPPSRRTRTLDTVANFSDILAMEADRERGRILFNRDGASSCRSCHRVREDRDTIGPDLSGIGSRYSRSELLTHLLEPSRFIDPKYIPFIVETVDGRISTGLLAERTAEEIVLRNVQNETVRIPLSEVESIVSQQKSIMPELLLRDLTAQQVADLIEYLSSLSSENP